MTEIAIGPAALSALSTEARAAIMVAAQRRHGLDAIDRGYIVWGVRSGV